MRHRPGQQPEQQQRQQQQPEQQQQRPQQQQQQPEQQQEQQDAAAARAGGGSQQRPQQQRRPPALASALAGAMSGAAISACVQPLDVLRTRMQADAAMGVSRGLVQTLQVLLREGGVRGLWRGTGPTVVRLSVGAGINFVALENLKHLVLDLLPASSGQLGYLQAAAVGGLARALSAAVMSPVTLVKTRMEYGGPNHIPYRSTGHALASIAAAEGPAALFRGLAPTVLTNAPFSALYYMMYTRLKHALSTWDGGGGDDGGSGSSSGGSSSNGGSSGGALHPTAVNFVSGVLAATAATLLTQPTDVVRTRMQLGLPGVARGDALSTLGHVLQSSGPHALLAGAAPRVLKRTLQTALVWTLYEELLPRLSSMYHLATAQRAAEHEQQQQLQAQAQRPPSAAAGAPTDGSGGRR